MRKTMDRLISWTGLVVAAVLLLAGGLLTWASNFIGDNVKEQLSSQHITMPQGKAIEDPAIKPFLSEFAGQPMVNGTQAKAYADHYILVHMNESSGGKSYSEVGAALSKLKADPNADKAAIQELTDTKASLFQGSTLRGLLLYGYAFDTMGRIAGIAAFGAFIGGALMALLGALGLRHASKVHEESTVPAAVRPARPATA